MAKRRNAPALFELLRDSNSTRTGQIGGEQLRSQLGGGVVKNAAPRPPGHPSLKAEETQSEAQIPVTPIAAQVASEAVVESKQPIETGPPAKGSPVNGSEADPLLAMPTFRAGRAVAEKPETPSGHEPAPAAPTATSIPAPRPVRVEVAQPKEAQPRVAKPAPAKAAAKPTPEPGIQEPRGVGTPGGATEDTPVTEAASGNGPDRLPLIRRVGNQLTVSTPAVGLAVATALVVVVISYVLGTLVGRKQASDELAPQLQQHAESTLLGLEGQQRPGRSAEERPIDPMTLARDPAANQPITIETLPIQQPPATQPEPIEPIQTANIDSREVGQNYLHLAPLADPEEARRFRAFLAGHGIDSFVRENNRGGIPSYEIITLVGIPSKGWSTSTLKIEHTEEVKRLGGIWFREHGGTIDFSRDNQSVWYNRKD